MSAVWEYQLSAGDVANGNIRFAKAPFSIAPEYIGGTNDSEKAASMLTVVFSPGSTSQQWLYGDKRIFANRNPYTKDFFARIGAAAGTLLKITQTSPDSIHIQKLV